MYPSSDAAQFEAEQRWVIRRQQDEDFLKRNRRGGLKDEKTHILLTTGRGEIEQCDVELVRRGLSK